MAPRRPSLIRAARAAIREDRLTELLAVALGLHRPFAHMLLRRAMLPADGPVEVSTQVWTRRGKRVDLQIVSLDAEGRIAGVLWSEHKTGSAYGPDQLPGYATDLAEGFNGPTQLITIVDRPTDAPANDRWVIFTWRDVALMAAEAGVEETDPPGLQWRKQAQRASVPARQRVIHELLIYLEEEHKAVTDPISHLDVIAFSRTNRADQVFRDVISRAAELSGLDPSGGVHSGGDRGTYWQLFKLPSSWAETLDGHAELHARDVDMWAYPRVDEPAFGAGFTLGKRYYDPLRDGGNREWLETVESLDFTVALDRRDGVTRVYRTLYVSELISKGATTDAQATFLADWTEESITTLQEHDPGLVLHS